MNMNFSDKSSALKNLVIASLISEGELLDINGESELHVPFTREKSVYLYNYLRNNNLKEYVSVEPRKEQFKINLNEELRCLVSKWFIKGTKIFSKNLGLLLNFNAIILCINLFGTRKLEGIGISTTVHKDFLKTLSYCIEKMLSLSVIPGKNQLKIPEVPVLLLETMDKISTIESTEIANYLTNAEKNKLREAIFHKGGKSYV
ncbi:hypothetical protein NC797_07180 [Aquibacillus sp. 3ASR75-11]|uniref:Uncharacterized protein n=1 Tax=Terrihalobacillus insolitus TaxID=2950438 RepID=A0A9X3WRY5_9BACI|nr:hypothetical protein [Terrihalobacillus insolitus]MDC3424290.1 hypothetical protein [Terrihalobacillus insolitus]